MKEKIKILLQRIGRWLQCYVLHSHEWTCDAVEGKPPDPARMAKLNWLEYYEEYTRMYCKHCPKEERRSILK